MKTIRFTLWAIAMCGALLFWHSLALADGGTAAPAETWKAYLPEIVMAVCALASWLSRWATSINFFHTMGGAALLAFLTAAATALTSLATAGTLTQHAVVSALLGALFTALGMNNPSMTGKPTDPASGTKMGAPIILPFLLVGALGMSGCTPGGKALAACELGQLPQVLQSVIAKVAAIVAQPGGWENDLEQLGIQVGPGQLSCVEQAIAAALEPSAASPDTPTKALMRQRLTAHAAKHPRACRPITLSRAEFSLVRW